MASFESLDNETYSAARKQDDQWVASITPADFFIVNEVSLTTIEDCSFNRYRYNDFVVFAFTLKSPDTDTEAKQR